MGANQSNDGELAQERGWAGREYSHASGKGHYSNVNKKSKAKPSPPLKVKAVDVTHNSISLSWLPPRHVDGSSVIAYTVEMATLTSGGDKVWKVLTKSCQGTNYEARHLEANTNYIFRVRAENIYGVGKHSTPSEVITTNIFETPSASERTLGVPTASNTSPEKSPLGSTTSSKRFSFNMHLDGGVTSILNHSDIVLNSSSSGTPYSTSTLSLDKTDNKSQSTLTRNNVQRTSWQSGRKVSLPILLPGTGQNSLNRLRESRNSLRTSTSDLQITNSTSRESTRNKFRDSRSSFGSSNSDVTVSTSSAEDSKKKSSGSRSSLQSSHSDVTLSNSRDGCSIAGSKNSLCDSLNGNDSCEITDNTVLTVDNEINNKDAVETNNNNNKDDNRNEMDNQNETNDDDDDDVYKLKEQLKNMETPEEKLKFCELQEKRNTIQDAILSPPCESQKGYYYDSLENPWERDTSVDGMSERIMEAPFCDDIKMALYVKNLPEDHQSYYVSEGHHPAMSNADQPGDFRTLRSVLQSSNMIVKTSRSLPDVVGVVMGDGGESRTLTRGKLTTIMDADEEEDPVRVTTL